MLRPRLNANSRVFAGDVLLSFLVFSDGQGRKRRPVLVVHDFGDVDVLVVPVTSHPARVQTDVVLLDWRGAGLMLRSTVRAEKRATIENFMGTSCGTISASL